MSNATDSEATIPSTDMEPCTCDAQVGTKEPAGLDSPCRLHIHSRRYRLADADGISGKAAIDGLVHAGVLTDDSPAYVEAVTFSQEKIKKKEIEETIITIYRGNDDS